MACQLHCYKGTICPQCIQPQSQQMGSLQAQAYQGGILLGQADYSDLEYNMFKKYAHLEDGELLRLFLEENKKIDTQAQAEANAILSKAEQDKEHHMEIFWQWCAKYKKHLTKERLEEKLKAFL